MNIERVFADTAAILHADASTKKVIEGDLLAMFVGTIHVPQWNCNKHLDDAPVWGMTTTPTWGSPRARSDRRARAVPDHHATAAVCSI
jgi:hypothetical protein